MNGNSYYITASFIPYNTDSYYSVITITVYQTCPKSSPLVYILGVFGIIATIELVGRFPKTLIVTKLSDH
jgi:hypothetical protein